MFDFLKISKKQIKEQTLEEIKTEFLFNFFEDKNHQWINNNPQLKRWIKLLFSTFKKEHFLFFKNHPTYFIPCEANLSCAIGNTKDSHLILFFPEVIDLIHSGLPEEGIAVIAHELGHIYYQHSEVKINNLKAQIEADHFAFELGFGYELQKVLLKFSQNMDCKVRISILTSKILTK